MTAKFALDLDFKKRQQNKKISGKNFDTTVLTHHHIILRGIHIMVNATIKHMSIRCRTIQSNVKTKHKLNHCFCLHSLRLLPKLPAHHTLTYNTPRGPQL